jgi:hypothetical protein
MGDSPAALWDGQRLHVPPLHAPEYHSDAKRIQAFIGACLDSEGEEHFRYRQAGVGGGYVWRISYGDYADGVAMTRAIGDGRFGSLLIRRPEIHTRELPVAEGAVLLATDGVLTNDSSPRGVRAQMGRVMKQWLNEGNSIGRVGSSIPMGSGDNRTLVGMRFWC